MFIPLKCQTITLIQSAFNSIRPRGTWIAILNPQPIIKQDLKPWASHIIKCFEKGYRQSSNSPLPFAYRKDVGVDDKLNFLDYLLKTV